MAASIALEDIWEAPIDPLFLASDDENDQIMPDAPPRGPAPEIDIDAVFAGLDTLPDRPGGDSGPPDPTPHQILSSSPAHHLDGDDNGEGEKDGKKPKKKTMRLDEGRLIGDAGFPQLIEDTKKIKIKGKGHEASDLNRLLQVYQFWTHRLYPKTPFKDTVDRVEKLCHSKRMHNKLSVWRDEAHGIVNGKKPGDGEDEDDAVIDLTDPTIHGPGSDQAEYASSSSHAATRPPSSVDGAGDSDDVGSETDLAAMDAVAKTNARQPDPSRGQRAVGPMPENEEDAAILDAENQISTVSRGETEDDDEEAFMEWQETYGADAEKPAPRDEETWDDEAWNAMDDMSENAKSAVTPAPQPTVVSSVEEDSEDMYVDGS